MAGNSSYPLLHFTDGTDRLASLYSQAGVGNFNLTGHLTSERLTVQSLLETGKKAFPKLATCNPFNTCQLPLRSSGNPGVNGVSDGGANWKRLGQCTPWCTATRRSATAGKTLTFLSPKLTFLSSKLTFLRRVNLHWLELLLRFVSAPIQASVPAQASGQEKRVQKCCILHRSDTDCDLPVKFLRFVATPPVRCALYLHGVSHREAWLCRRRGSCCTGCR